jgi:hypothetical protein
MCRNIRILFNFEPPATEEEVRAAAIQYVRKVSGTNKPSKVNEAIFNKAVDEISHITWHLVVDMVANAPPRTREEEAAKARLRWQRRLKSMRS